MTLGSLLAFCAVYAIAVATPGPGVTAIVARVLARGLPGAPAFIAGFVAGDLVWLVLAIAGLSMIANTFATLFLVIKWAGIVYLLTIAWRLWTAPAAAADLRRIEAADAPGRLFLAGFALTLGNPKVMVFFLAILPTIVDLRTVSFLDGLLLAGFGTVIIGSVLAAYALLADRARHFVQTPRAMRVMNRICGATIAGAAAAVAAR